MCSFGAFPWQKQESDTVKLLPRSFPFLRPRAPRLKPALRRARASHLKSHDPPLVEQPRINLRHGQRRRVTAVSLRVARCAGRPVPHFLMTNFVQFCSWACYCVTRHASLLRGSGGYHQPPGAPQSFGRYHIFPSRFAISSSLHKGEFLKWFSVPAAPRPPEAGGGESLIKDRKR
jgi:hypothetical protein